MDDKIEVTRNVPLHSKTNTSLPDKYYPELTLSLEYDDDAANYYHNLIGILIWDVELVRIHICVYLEAPRTGYLEKILHIFAYINLYEQSKWIYDPAHKKGNLK